MFSRAVRAEFNKAFSTRLWWLLLLILAGYAGLGAAGIAFSLTTALPGATSPMLMPSDDVSSVVYSMVTATGFVFPVIFGAMSVTTEVRHRTLTASFLATPSRGAVLGAKLIVAIVIGALYGIAGLVATVGLGAAVLSAAGVDTAMSDSGTWAMLARIVLAMSIWGALGVGLGALVPSQVGSIVAILAFTQFVEPIIRVAGAVIEWLGEIVRFLPGAAGDDLVGASFYSVFAPGGSSLEEWWQAALVLAGYAVLFTLLGRFTFWRRDVS
jgi:ABC-2 type transport system permease protein